MLGDAAFQMIGDTGVEYAGCAGEDIDVIDAHRRGFWHE